MNVIVNKTIQIKMVYWILGITLIILTFVGLSSNKASARKSIWAMFIAFTLFQGLRWNTGADWQQYLRVFQTCDWNHIFSFDRGDGTRNMEFGYVFINILIKTLFKEYTFFLLITCGFINLMYMKIVKLYIPEKYQPLAYALSLMMSNIFPVRQALACSVFIGFGVSSILSHNWKQYLIVVCTCCTIHTSCLILVPFYFVGKYIKSSILICIFLSFSIIVGYVPALMDKVIQLPIIRELAFASLVERYQDTGLTVEKSGLLDNTMTIIFVILQILLFSWLREKHREDNFNYKLYTLCLNFYVITATCRQISIYPGLNEFARFSYFAGIGYIILVSSTFIYFLKNYKKYTYGVELVFVVFMLFKVNAIFKDSYSELFVPYYSVFEHSPQRDGWILF